MKKITTTKFYSILLNKIYSSYDGNGKTSKLLFANDEIMNLIDKVESFRMMESQEN